MSLQTNKIGQGGEEKAVSYLIGNGYSILERNWRIRDGELDIIAKKNEIVVFVEVKTMPNATIDMLQSVLGKQKQKRIIKTSKRFLLNHREYSKYFIRFDVIILDMHGLPEVYHIENAFSEFL